MSDDFFADGRLLDSFVLKAFEAFSFFEQLVSG